MKTILFIAVAGGFILLIACLNKSMESFASQVATETSFEPLPYESQPLFTPSERSFLGVLEQALNNQYRVFGKVRLGDVIHPRRGMTKSMFYTALNKVNKKHPDFVVCRKNDCEVLGVVELEDKAHEREDRKERDDFVDRAIEVSCESSVSCLLEALDG